MTASGILEPLNQLPHAMLARDLDLHVERAGPRLGRAAAGEAEPLWVASLSRGDFAIEAQGRTPQAALERVWAEMQTYAFRAATLGGRTS